MGPSRVKSRRIKQHGAFLPHGPGVVLGGLPIECNVVISSDDVSEAKNGDGGSYSNDVSRGVWRQIDRHRLPLKDNRAESPN